MLRKTNYSVQLTVSWIIDKTSNLILFTEPVKKGKKLRNKEIR